MIFIHFLFDIRCVLAIEMVLKKNHKKVASSGSKVKSITRMYAAQVQSLFRQAILSVWPFNQQSRVKGGLSK